MSLQQGEQGRASVYPDCECSESCGRGQGHLPVDPVTSASCRGHPQNLLFFTHCLCVGQDESHDAAGVGEALIPVNLAKKRDIEHE